MPNDNLRNAATGIDAHPAGTAQTRAHPAQAGYPGDAGVLQIDRGEEGVGEHQEIDLLAYWRVLVKRRWLMLGITGAVLLVSLLFTLLATPIYRATVSMQIDNEEQHVVQVGGVSAQAAFDPDFQETQYQLLSSRALAERVAGGLHLDAPTRERLSRWSWQERLKILVHPAAGAASTPAATDAQEELRAGAELVQHGLTVEPVRSSRLVRINFDSPVPAFSAQVANAIAEGFIASGLERRFGASTYAKTYLESQLKLVKSRLEDSERQLVAFAQKENLVSTPEGQSLSSKNLSDLNSALATAQEQRIRAQARWGEAQAARGAALPADMLSNSIIHTLQEQRAQLQGQYQQKSQVFKADYPEMRQLKGQMDELDRQIGSELGNIRASVRAEYVAASSQESLLQSQLNALRTATLDVDGRSIQYNIIKREVDTNRQLYDGLLQRYKEVGVAGDVRSNNVSIIDRAEVPSQPFKPSLPVNLAIGMLLGLVLAVLAVSVLEFIDDTLKTPDDVEQKLKLAVLGLIPKLSKLSPGEAVKDPRSAFSEAYRSVRTALQFSTQTGVPKSLLITSAVSGEGKTTSALTLARNLAELGKRVLLIDGDLRNPSIHKLMGMGSQVGLSNVLAGGATADAAILHTEQERLDVMVAGPLPPNPAELLSGSKLTSLLDYASEHYDQVIIDGPPIMGIADAPILAHAAAGTVMVVHSGKTHVASAQAAVKRLHAARALIVGSLLTQYDSKAAGYGYQYEGYYAYGIAPHVSKQ